ncbi:pilus assembly protein CpaB [Selenomonas ruminantium]|uniref:Pilus assembly protein CpaB n=2 Tax=Selenomonas ruminantium TaxID=971 RepID=A0A1M6U0N6_SELRU|nr:pilus assembly protein CpaB [Selenomonas ruminantium]
MLESKLTYKQWVSLAAGVSCLLGMLVYFSLSSVETAAKDSKQVEMVRVVVAKQDIPERTVIKESMLNVVDMPADVVPAEAVHEVSEITGSPTSVAIQKGDLLTTKKVYADVRMAGFTGTIPPNCRAVSVAITDITGVSGFAKPGDFVDVMLVSGSRETGFKGEVLLQNVQLLAINKTGSQAADNNKSEGNDRSEENGAIKGSSDAMATATLALPLDEALKLATASQKGTIYLVLRPVAPADVFSIDTDYMIPAERQSTAAPQPRASAPSPAAAPAAAPAVAPASAGPPKQAAQPAAQGGHFEIIRGVQKNGER